MAAGSVRSSTCSAGAPVLVALLRATTSGKRLEPPIPASSTWSTPAASTLHRAAVDSSPADMSATTDSQPRRSAISVGSSRQSVWSCAQVRATASRATRSARAAAAGSVRDPSRSGVSSRITPLS